VKLLSTTALAGILFAGLAFASVPAAAQDARALLDRMERMERDMTTLQQQVYRGGGGGSSTVITSPALGGGVSSGSGAAMAPLPPDAAGRIEVRMSALEDQIRSLTGQVEEARFRNQQLKEQVDRMQADFDLRFKELQGGAATAAAQPNQPSEPPPAGPAKEGVLGSMPKKDLDKELAGKPASTAELKGATPKEQYDYAYGLVMKDRDAAEKALLAFVKAHPTDPLTGNAYYWLGETYFVKGDFKSAAVQFLDGYRKFPKSQKAAHNLLKLGMSLSRTDDLKSACAAFGKLQQEYPDADATIKRALQTERQKAKCS
jgi:tol-pal system protein YbgF